MKLYPFHKIGLLLLVLGNFNLAIAEELDEQLTVNATTTDAEGTSSNDIQEAHKLAEIFILQKQLVYKLLQNIGVTPDKLSPDVKKAIDKPQTTNVKAFKAFCYCLDLMDKGEFKKAREQCDDAVRYDPNFALAQQLLVSIPDHQETMPEIVSDHMNRSVAIGLKPSPPEVLVLHNIPPDEPPVQLPRDLDTVNRDSAEIDRSTPPCDNKGQCGFYSTFLASRDAGGVKTESTAPFLNRNAVSIPPTNAKGVISINQIGYEGKGYLNLRVNPQHSAGRITGFKDMQLNESSSNVPNGGIDRVPAQNNNYTGLKLGTYYADNFFPNTDTNKSTHLFQGNLYYAEGQVTPADNVKNLGPVHYSGVASADFSVKGIGLVCDSCGTFSGTLNYGAEKLETFKLEASGKQEIDGIGAQVSPITARITANDISMKPNGEFQFDQNSAGKGSFQIITKSEVLSGEGVVAGRPFGLNAESVGGVFAIHGENIQGVGNFGGSRK